MKKTDLNAFAAKSENQQRLQNKKYAATSRDGWSALGLTSITVKVPIAQKHATLRLMEQMKADHLIAIAEDATTDLDTYMLLASRNMPKMAAQRVAERYRDTLDTPEGNLLFAQYEDASAKMHLSKRLAAGEQDPELKVVSQAKTVAYAHAAASAVNYMRLLVNEIEYAMSTTGEL